MDSAFRAIQALGPIAAISPHYDDAVFSCGHLLGAAPCSTVITVCTGQPAQCDVLTDWDARCGFIHAAHALQARRAENTGALAALQAQSVELDFLDDQYLQTAQDSAELLIDALAVALSQLQPETVIFPLGLFHSDHIRVSDAVISLSFQFEAVNWLAYEDIPYCRQTNLVDARIKQLAGNNTVITPANDLLATALHACPSTTKERAVNAYASQFRGLGYDDAGPIMQLPEKYWQLHINPGLP